MRAQTPSYVVSVKLQLSEQIENHLEKSFRISNSAYNEGISFGLKRFEAMKRNPYYQELLEARRLAKAGIDKLKKAKKKTKGLIQQVKEKTLTPEGLTLLRHRTRQNLFFLHRIKRF